MFPYVGLATLPLFCEFDWPKQLGCKIKKVLGNMKVVVKGVMEIRSFRKETKKSEKGKGIEGELPPKIITLKHKLVVALVFSHCGLQMFLPYSHFITKVSFWCPNLFLFRKQLLFQGYNNWTNGLYGYSWDMMVHSWDTILVVVKVVDNRSDREHFLDPSAWVNSDRWTKHGDMAMQYAQCLKENLLYDFKRMLLINVVFFLIKRADRIFVIYLTRNCVFRRKILKTARRQFSNVYNGIHHFREHFDLFRRLVFFEWTLPTKDV